jgi:hypothetical protein
MSFRVTKRLTANDIGDTGGHQAGITIPKAGPMIAFFPRLDVREFNPRATLRAIDFHTNDMFDLEFIYYNGRLLGRSTVASLDLADSYVGMMLLLETSSALREKMN